MSEPTRDIHAEENILVAITRLEAKVDVALARQTATLSKHDETLSDHESRIRKVEERKTVSPAALWATVGSAIAAFGVLAPYLSAVL